MRAQALILLACLCLVGVASTRWPSGAQLDINLHHDTGALEGVGPVLPSHRRSLIDDDDGTSFSSRSCIMQSLKDVVVR